MISPGRTLPHSLEAEEYLLSSCLLDGQDVVSRCLEAEISPESFYDAKHGIIYHRLLDLYGRQLPISIDVVAEELKEHRQLEQIGGYAFLTQVSSRIPTTAQAGYFIEKVHEQDVLRRLIRSATGAVEDCYGFTGGIEEFYAELMGKMERLRPQPKIKELRPATDFVLPPAVDPNALLGRNRYIGRGDSALLVSSSGMGKSVMQVEWAVHCAVGRDYLGISCPKPLKSLIVQAEDSEGDVGEIMFSCRMSMKLTEEEWDLVGKNVIFVREKVARGEVFISRLRGLIKKVKPDLVWLNPLHAYAGCDIADAKEMGHFLRAGLNAINSEESFAYMIVHHTPKPVSAKGVQERKWNEFMYDAAGSAELVNWARAVVTLKPCETEGHFHLILAKRGKRAGVKIRVPGEGDGIFKLEVSTKIPIKQTTETIEVPGRAERFNLLHWETRPADEEEILKDAEPKKDERTRYRPQYSDEDLIIYFPASTTEGHSLSACQRLATAGCGISRTSFYEKVRGLIEAGFVQRLVSTALSRTKLGDTLFKRLHPE